MDSVDSFLKRLHKTLLGSEKGALGREESFSGLEKSSYLCRSMKKQVAKKQLDILPPKKLSDYPVKPSDSGYTSLVGSTFWRWTGPPVYPWVPTPVGSFEVNLHDTSVL